MKRFLDVLFWITLIAFLALGAAVVFGQIAGVLLNNASLVAGADALFGDWAYSMSTACAAAALLLGYARAGHSPKD